MEIRLGTIVEVHNIAEGTREDRCVVTDILLNVDENWHSIIVRSEVYRPGKTREFGYFAEGKYWKTLGTTWWMYPWKGSDPDGLCYRLEVVCQPRVERSTTVPAVAQ